MASLQTRRRLSLLREQLDLLDGLVGIENLYLGVARCEPYLSMTDYEWEMAIRYLLVPLPTPYDPVYMGGWNGYLFVMHDPHLPEASHRHVAVILRSARTDAIRRLAEWIEALYGLAGAGLRGPDESTPYLFEAFVKRLITSAGPSVNLVPDQSLKDLPFPEEAIDAAEPDTKVRYIEAPAISACRIFIQQCLGRNSDQADLFNEERRIADEFALEQPLELEQIAFVVAVRRAAGEFRSYPTIQQQFPLVPFRKNQTQLLKKLPPCLRDRIKGNGKGYKWIEKDE